MCWSVKHSNFMQYATTGLSKPSDLTKFLLQLI